MNQPLASTLNDVQESLVFNENGAFHDDNCSQP